MKSILFAAALIAAASAQLDAYQEGGGCVSGDTNSVIKDCE